MPYTEQKDREKETVDTKGDLNQKFSTTISNYLNVRGLSYNGSISEIIESLEEIVFDPRDKYNVQHQDSLEYQLRRVVDKFNGTAREIRGAARACQLEFYRRIAVPYENEKLSLNGDVYK